MFGLQQEDVLGDLLSEFQPFVGPPLSLLHPHLPLVFLPNLPSLSSALMKDFPSNVLSRTPLPQPRSFLSNINDISVFKFASVYATITLSNRKKGGELMY